MEPGRDIRIETRRQHIADHLIDVRGHVRPRRAPERRHHRRMHRVAGRFNRLRSYIPFWWHYSIGFSTCLGRERIKIAVMGRHVQHVSYHYRVG